MPKKHPSKRPPARTRRTLWALYLSSVTYSYSVNGIELHRTRRAALDSAAELYEVEIDDLDDDNADEAITEAAGSESWYLCEVEVPKP